MIAQKPLLGCDGCRIIFLIGKESSLGCRRLFFAGPSVDNCQIVVGGHIVWIYLLYCLILLFCLVVFVLQIIKKTQLAMCIEGIRESYKNLFQIVQSKG